VTRPDTPRRSPEVAPRARDLRGGTPARDLSSGLGTRKNSETKDRRDGFAGAETENAADVR